MKSYSEGTPAVTYAYDPSCAKGYLASVSTGVSTTGYGYCGDLLGRITSSTQTMAGQAYALAYGYNRNGNVSSETLPSGRVLTMAVDGAGRVSAVNGQATGQPAVSYVSLATYEANHAVKQLTLGNSLAETQDHNARLQTTALKLGTAALPSSLAQIDLGYGTTANNGSVLSQTITAAGVSLTQTYGYDAFNRLKTSAEGSNWTRNHDYDQYGNGWVTTWAGIQPHAILTAQAETAYDAATNRRVAFGYDPAGNVTAANSVTYAYDAENRQASNTTVINGTPYTNIYAYDGQGRRVKKTVGSVNTVYVYDAAGQMVAEYTDGPATGTAGTQYLFADHLGTTRAVTDGRGTLLARHDYLPFGEEIDASVGRSSIAGYGDTDSINQKFTGKERDTESTLDYFGARYFGAAQARFTAPDEPFIDQDSSDPQSWNLFSYVRNNPLANLDADGNACVSIDKGRTWKDDASGGQSCAEAAQADRSKRPDVTVTATYTQDERIRLLAYHVDNLTSVGSLADVGRNGIEGAMAVEGVRGLATGLWNGIGALRSLPQVRWNYFRGVTVGENLVRVGLWLKGYKVVGRHVTAYTSAGKRVINWLVETPSGELLAIEVKTGSGARNTLQLAKDIAMETQGARLAGVNAGRRAGEALKIRTEVWSPF